MRVRRGAAAEEPQGGDGGNLVPGTGRDEDGVAGADFTRFAVDFHGSGPFQQKIKFLAQFVIMAVGGPSRGEEGLGEALVRDRGVRQIENTAYL